MDCFYLIFTGFGFCWQKPVSARHQV